MSHDFNRNFFDSDFWRKALAEERFHELFNAADKERQRRTAGDIRDAAEEARRSRRRCPFCANFTTWCVCRPLDYSDAIETTCRPVDLIGPGSCL